MNKPPATDDRSDRFSYPDDFDGAGILVHGQPLPREMAAKLRAKKDPTERP